MSRCTSPLSLRFALRPFSVASVHLEQVSFPLSLLFFWLPLLLFSPFGNLFLLPPFPSRLLPLFPPLFFLFFFWWLTGSTLSRRLRTLLARSRVKRRDEVSWLSFFLLLFFFFKSFVLSWEVECVEAKEKVKVDEERGGGGGLEGRKEEGRKAGREQ